LKKYPTLEELKQACILLGLGDQRYEIKVSLGLVLEVGRRISSLPLSSTFWRLMLGTLGFLGL
jgi:hypothetical protein